MDPVDILVLNQHDEFGDGHEGFSHMFASFYVYYVKIIKTMLEKNMLWFLSTNFLEQMVRQYIVV